MTLIKSISGIRGTIGGKPGDNLTPEDVMKYALAFGTWVKRNSSNNKIVIGRDARISGQMVSNLVSGTLLSLGLDVVDLGLSTTPTVEIAVEMEQAGGGIIITASHNPKQWNALKLLNENGEFLSASAGEEVLSIAEEKQYDFQTVDTIGKYTTDDSYIDKHIELILKLKLVDVNLIKAANFKVAIDCVNSTGGIALPKLLKALGVKEVIELYTTPNGDFPHNPEPLPEHLQELSKTVVESGADLGISVDPDVDRLALVSENGAMFGEEYTLVAVADYILSHNKGNTVSNLSSTRALKDVTVKHGAEYFPAAVGEVNVVKKMKEVNAVIGGEGNGGIIYPELHYGRDALAGIALFLTHLAKSGLKTSELRASYPDYFMAKKKVDLTAGTDIDKILESVKAKYSKHDINTEDGVKINFDHGWVHLRKSNTEPIIRVYSESHSPEEADALAFMIMDDIK